MIEQREIDGKPATVAYLTKDLQPTSLEEAEIVRVLFDNGDTAWLTAKGTDLAGAPEAP